MKYNVDLKLRMNEISKQTLAIKEQVEKAIADIILRHALELVPVKSGGLKGSGSTKPEKKGHAIEFKQRYTSFVELGTKYMKPQSFLVAAACRSSKEAKEAFANLYKQVQ